MILNDNNIIYTQRGVDSEQLLKSDQAIIYRSPSKIKFMGYAGTADRISDSKTINSKYFEVLSKMRAKISLGSTGTGEQKQYKNAHLYYEEAEYLDGIDRICYLYQESDKLKLSEYKKGSRGSRYSALYNILKNKLEKNGFERDGESFLINLENVKLFVEIINEICEEKKDNKYCLLKSNRIDELNFGIFNVAYWDYKDKIIDNKEKIEPIVDLSNYSSKIIKNIDQCNSLDELEKIESDIEAILGFCKSKIKVMKMI
jgi:hypothetical protein